jgi:hypothetical protein
LGNIRRGFKGEVVAEAESAGGSAVTAVPVGVAAVSVPSNREPAAVRAFSSVWLGAASLSEGIAVGPARTGVVRAAAGRIGAVWGAGGMRLGSGRAAEKVLAGKIGSVRNGLPKTVGDSGLVRIFRVSAGNASLGMAAGTDVFRGPG